MAITNRNRLLEKYVQVVREDGLNTNKNVNIGTAGATSGATLSVGSGGISTTGSVATGTQVISHTPVAVNSTATLTAAQVIGGYITSTSAAATTMTLPTGTLLGAAVGATQGTVIVFYVDNTAGSSTVTVAIATNGILSALAVAASASFGLLTVPSGVTGVAEFTIMFSSPTAYVFSRTA
jgi:hypothetical protein